MNESDFFKELYNSSSLGIYIYQENGKIVFANKALSNITGYSTKELLNKSFLDFLNKKDAEKIKENIERRLKNEHFNYEYVDFVYKAKDGLIKPVKVFAYTITYKNKPSGIVFVIDNTEAKSYEKLFKAITQINRLITKTKNEKSLLRSICNILVNSIGYISASIGTINQNTKLYNILHVSTKIPGFENNIKSIKISIDPSLPYGKGTVHQAYSSGKIAILSNVLANENMKPWWEYHKKYNIYSACSIPIFKNGKIEYILLIHDNISDSFNKNNIELLKEIQSITSFALNKIEKDKNITILNKAIEKSHEWVIITNKDGIILHSNEAVLTISGYTHSELLGKKFVIFKPKPIDKTIKNKHILQTLLQGKTFRGRFVNTDKHGNRFYLDSITIPIIIDGQITHFVNLSRNITDTIEKEKQIKFQSKIYNTLYNLNKLYISSKSQNEFLSNLPNTFIEHMGMDIAFIATLKNNTINIEQKATTKNSHKKFLENYIKILKKSSKTPLFKLLPFYKAIKNKKIYIVNDIRKKHLGLVNKHMDKYDIHAGCAIPIITKRNFNGVLILASSKKNIFNKDVYNLLQVIMNNTLFILDKLEKDKFNKMTISALDAGYNFVIILNKHLKIEWINASAEKFFGYNKEELIKKSCQMIAGKEKNNQFYKLICDVDKENRALSGIITYKAKSNKNITAHTVIVPFVADKNTKYYIATGKDITKESQLKEQIDKLLHFDSLTNLPNRSSFANSIDSFANRILTLNKTMGCVSIINPTGFFQINRAFGFENGNKVLIEIGKRIKNALRTYDIVAKLESDRFGILLKELKNEEDALIIIEKVLDELTKPYTINNQQINISFNTGLSLIPKDGSSSNILINKAQSALADAKRKGENTFGFFRKDLEKQAFNKLQLKNNMIKAIENKEFIVHYQPYFDKYGNIKGAEALLRWSKNGKIVPPMEFIPYLEETLMISKVDSQVLDIVLDMISFFKQQNIQPVPISINIAPQSCKLQSFKDNLAKIIAKPYIDHNLINIEIIERSFMDDIEYMKNLIKTLRKSGFLFSIDDFGTGYSSLSYLSQLLVDYIKIDISFIRRITEDKNVLSIVETIIYLAHKLNMKTIAEGVETEEQKRLLIDIGCDYLQGYLLSKPLTPEKFKEMLQNQSKI